MNLWFRFKLMNHESKCWLVSFVCNWVTHIRFIANWVPQPNHMIIITKPKKKKKNNDILKVKYSVNQNLVVSLSFSTLNLSCSCLNSYTMLIWLQDAWNIKFIANWVPQPTHMIIITKKKNYISKVKYCVIPKRSRFFIF